MCFLVLSLPPVVEGPGTAQAVEEGREVATRPAGHTLGCFTRVSRVGIVSRGHGRIFVRRRTGRDVVRKHPSSQIHATFLVNLP